MATDLQILQALRAAINAQLGAAGPVSLIRIGKALARGLARLSDATYSTPAAGQWARTLPDGQRNYVISGSSGKMAELHVWPTGSGGTAGAVMHVYSGTADTDAGSPLDGLVTYYSESVDPSLVPDDAAALTWLQNRIAAGLP